MPSKYISINEEIVKAGSAVVTIQNRAFRYGDALFETIRIANGKIQFLADHISRLIEGMKVLKMSIPANFNAEHFESEILKLTDKNKTNNNQLKEGWRVRLTVFRNEGGFYTPFTSDVSYVLETDSLDENTYLFNSKGIAVDIFSDVRKPINELSNLKTTNCLIFILAGIHKTENRVDDCLIFNDRGNVAEAISSNIFIVKDRDLYTPSLEQGCVAGIMRQQIINLAKKTGIKINESGLTSDALLHADELFLTNAIDGIRWVGRYRQKRYINSVSSGLFEELMAICS